MSHPSSQTGPTIIDLRFFAITFPDLDVPPLSHTVKKTNTYFEKLYAESIRRKAFLGYKNIVKKNNFFLLQDSSINDVTELGGRGY